jgi:hypothetical protein
MSPVPADLAPAGRGVHVRSADARERRGARAQERRSRSRPAFFATIGFSVELSSRAYILQRSGNENEYPNSIGHNLVRAIARATDAQR